MTLGHLVWRTIRHYRGASAAVMAGLAVATAVVTGSLVIGSSLRGSLLDVSLRRLGGVHYAAILPRPISDRAVTGTAVLPLLQTTGAATPAMGEPTPVPVTVWGIDEGFGKLANLAAGSRSYGPVPSDGVLINAALARDLGLKQGDEIALSVSKPQRIGMDSLFARRKLAEVMATLQAPLAAILPDNGVGDFRLDGQSARPRNVFVARETLARSLGLAGKANVLVAGVVDWKSDNLDKVLGPLLTLADHGLHLRQKGKGLSLTSEAFTLTAEQVQAAQAAALQTRATADPCSVHLATTIKAPNGRRIAYAIIAGTADARRLGLPRPWSASGMEIALGEWAAQDLQAKPGDLLTLEYLQASPGGAFPKRSLRARLLGVLPLRGPTADPHLMPEYEGLTDAVTLGDWKPPFPIDMKRVTARDEEYWKRYQTIPKAFVSADVTRIMWGNSGGNVTSLEIIPPAGLSMAGLEPRFDRWLLDALQSSQPLVNFTDVAALARRASAGSTDFSQLFLALSMFIIAAGAGLAAMLIRLGVERREKQIVLLLAIGWPARRVRALLMRETMLLNVGGIVLGLPLGLLYAQGLIAAMAWRWRAAVGDAAAIWLHVTGMDLLIGAVAGLLVGWLTAWLSLRRRAVPGSAGFQPARERHAGWKPAVLRLVLPAAAILLAVGLLIWAQTGGATARPFAFFGVGLLLLIAALLALNLRLAFAARARRVLSRLRGLAWRNAALNPRRSLLVCGLIASAGFVIIAAAVSTRDAGRVDTFDRAGPTGGFNLVATSTVPLPYDPATAEGRRNLGIGGEDEAVLSRAVVASYLASPGDDLGCTNAAKPNSPRLLAHASDPRLMVGRFDSVRIQTPQMGKGLANWIEADADRETLQWRLYKKSGDQWQTQDVHGRPLLLRLSAGFTRSIFAGQLLVSRGDLRQIYPEVTAPSYFLIETPRADEQAVIAALRRNLGDLGLQVRPTREVLAEYAQAQNVYLSMFLALGALGLLLGTVGLAVVTARNIIERRAELALLTATGFSRQRVVSLLLMEHGGLLALGLVVGCAAALIAMLPQLLSPESAVNWVGLAVALGAVLVVGLGANVVAIRRSLSDDLVAALRHE